MSYSTQNTIPSLGIVINWVARNFGYYVVLALAGAALYLVAATIYFWPIAATIVLNLIFTSGVAGAYFWDFYSTKHTSQDLEHEINVLKDHIRENEGKIAVMILDHVELSTQISTQMVERITQLETATQQFARKTAQLETEIQRLRRLANLARVPQPPSNVRS